LRCTPHQVGGADDYRDLLERWNELPFDLVERFRDDAEAQPALAGARIEYRLRPGMTCPVGVYCGAYFPNREDVRLALPPVDFFRG
ncbi:MAG TPA: hypothetical protein VGZ06_02985, partial [Candidatus Cybelea sp.]|nr:hypothetical protein [Candidatus Cybelea sp.]